MYLEEKAYSRATIVCLAQGIFRRRVQGFPTTSIIMRDPGLELLATRDLCFGRIGLIISSTKISDRGLTTTLMTAIPSRPIIFSKSTYAVASLFTCSTAKLKYVPFELDLVSVLLYEVRELAYLKILPHSLPLATLIVTWRKTASVLLSRTLIISFTLSYRR
jgi:hypothetical protein